jgi:hypothetical protein
VGANIYKDVILNKDKFLNYNNEDNTKKDDKILHSNVNESEFNDELFSQWIKKVKDIGLDTSSFSFDADQIKSILVSTGVTQSGTDSETGRIMMLQNNTDLDYAHKDLVTDSSKKVPDYIVKNAYDAVKLIFELENYVKD